MSDTTVTTAPPGARPLPATLELGAVHLTVIDVDRSVRFYQDVLGLRMHERDERSAVLGAGEEGLVVLHEDPEARPAGRHAGLYHFALLYPSRLELARAVVRLAATGTPIQGASDHGTHEAIYLADPDGLGIELAADRPRDEWAARGGYGAPQPLDTADLLSLAEGEGPVRHAGSGLRIGHVHLHVSALEPALRFYRDVIGFDVMFTMPTAAFVSAGGYHHHLAFNVWRGEGVPPAPSDAVGLRHWTVRLPEDDLEAIRDRARAAGWPHEQRNDGLELRDPGGTALLLAVQR